MVAIGFLPMQKTCILRAFASLTSSYYFRFKTLKDLRGFLPQCEEAVTQRTGGTQGTADKALRQKDRKDSRFWFGNSIRVSEVRKKTGFAVLLLSIYSSFPAHKKHRPCGLTRKDDVYEVHYCWACARNTSKSYPANHRAIRVTSLKVGLRLEPLRLAIRRSCIGNKVGFTTWRAR